MEDNDSTTDAFPLSEEEFRESYGVPRQDSYTCRACGETAYPPEGDIDTFDSEAAHIRHPNDGEDPVIVCWACLQTEDWEQRARKRDAESTTNRSGLVDRLTDSLGQFVERVRTRGSGQTGGDASASRPDPPDAAHATDETSELTQLDREELIQQLEQEREWASYLEQELHATEDELTAAQEELRQVRQQVTGDGPVELDASQRREPGVDPTALFDIREAVGNAIEAADATPIREGLVRVDQQLVDALATAGIEEVDTVGEADPRRHEVIETIPTADEPPGTILEEYRAGYQRGGAILRPAQVAVAAEASDDGRSDADDEPAGEGTR